MKKFVFCIIAFVISIVAIAQVDTTIVESLDGVSVVSFQRNTINTGSLITTETLVESNYGQEPSHLFKSMPSIIALSDNGTEFGYGYFRIRGLDQTRINVNLDGCPWNEAEDFGTYFANSPDLMSSMNSIKVERGASASYNGTAGSAGGINLESINLYTDNPSYVYVGGGSFNTYKTTVVYNTNINKWGIHVKASQSETDGFRDYGFNNSKALTLKVGYKFNDSHSIDFMTMNGYHRNGQAWLGNTLTELNVNPRANGNTKDEDDNWFMSMNRLQYKEWVTDNILLVSSLYYQGQTGSYRMDLDNYMKRMCDPSWENTGILYDYGLTHNMIGGNVITKIYLDKVVLNGGVNVYNFNRRHFTADKGINIPKEEYYDNNGNKTEVSGFVSASYKPISKLAFSGNVQYRYVNFSYTDNINSDMSFSAKDMGTLWNFVNFGLNAEYTPSNVVKLYARYNQVHREPTRSDMFGGNEYFIGEINTKTPEIANDIETGIELITNKFELNVNLFYMWFKNELVLNGEYGLNGLPCHENADESYRRGIEITANWNVVSHLHFDNNVSLSQNRVKTPTFGEKTHVLAPSMTWDSNLSWKADKWLVGANFNYRSSMYADMENKNIVPYNYTINLFGSIRFNKVELGLNLNNITNKVNYYNAAVGAEDVLYFRMSGFNFMTNLKIFF